MHERVDWLPSTLVKAADDVESQFEARLADSSALAVRVAFSVLRNQHDAEDVAQEAFAKAHRSFSQLRDRDRFRAWLVRMTWRLAIDRRRGDRRREMREQAAVPPLTGPTVEQTAIEAEREARVWRAVDELPEKLRAALVLSAIDGHGIGEVSALLGIPEGTVKSRLFLARKKLQELLS
jgi:RNA polymerase sigma-70 factor (ECF subfamily)